jgi:hypothetical protein
LENIAAKQQELISLLQGCVQTADIASKYKEEHDFLEILILDRT